MSNEVSICNQALSWLGANQITALNESSKEAQICDANYAELRDAVLEEHRWTFALATYKFGKSALVPNDDDNWRFKYTFNIPNNILHVMRVFHNPDSLYQTRWRRKGDRLYADYDTIYLETTLRVTSPPAFSTLFRQALVARIARDICLGLTRDQGLHKSLQLMYIEALDTAAASDGMQGINETLPPGLLIQARHTTGNILFHG